MSRGRASRSAAQRARQAQVELSASACRDDRAADDPGPRRGLLRTGSAGVVEPLLRRASGTSAGPRQAFQSSAFTSLRWSEELLLLARAPVLRSPGRCASARRRHRSRAPRKARRTQTAAQAVHAPESAQCPVAIAAQAPRGRGPRLDCATRASVRSACCSSCSAASRGENPAGGPAIPWAIVQCESGGQNLTPNSASASGYYQILDSTWAGLGGSTSHAFEGSKAEQDRLAAKLWAGGAGAHNWVCASLVGAV